MTARNRLRGAMVVNGVLLALLGAVTLAPRADAQRGSGRARGDYTMVSGRIQGGNSNVVYVLDAANQELIGLRWNESSKALEGVGYRDLQADAQAEIGR